ncbi:hypothetical protein CB1_000848012 [Camelus ferus]|nr:hypothetical protein CB1_000848012 [Camelus ferus]
MSQCQPQCWDWSLDANAAVSPPRPPAHCQPHHRPVTLSCIEAPHGGVSGSKNRSTADPCPSWERPSQASGIPTQLLTSQPSAPDTEHLCQTQVSCCYLVEEEYLIPVLTCAVPTLPSRHLSPEAAEALRQRRRLSEQAMVAFVKGGPSNVSTSGLGTLQSVVLLMGHWAEVLAGPWPGTTFNLMSWLHSAWGVLFLWRALLSRGKGCREREKLRELSGEVSRMGTSLAQSDRKLKVVKTAVNPSREREKNLHKTMSEQKEKYSSEGSAAPGLDFPSMQHLLSSPEETGSRQRGHSPLWSRSPGRSREDAVPVSCDAGKTDVGHEKGRVPDFG